MEEKTTGNNLRWQMNIFDKLKPSHTSPKFCGGSNTLTSF
jgi:hypothetical protein